MIMIQLKSLLQKIEVEKRATHCGAIPLDSHAFKYRMPKVSKDVFKFSFFPRSITEWNLLPADLVNCKTLSNFKLNLGKLVNK